MPVTLTERVRSLFPNPTAPLAVASVAPVGVETCRIGVEPGADFELGSVTKALTGMLYADAVERGEVRPDTEVGSLLDVEGPVGRATLEALVTHRSGLPRLERWSLSRGWQTARALLGLNPYTLLPDAQLRAIAATGLGPREPLYSNLGFILLGMALEAAASLSYAELIQARLAEPLDLRGLYVPSSVQDLRPTALLGTRWGRQVAPWAGPSLAAAGGVRGTLADLTTLVERLLDGTAPGIAALDPITDFGGGCSIGAAWLTVVAPDRPSIVWHNGGTGGFRSFVGIERPSGCGVVVLSAAEHDVTNAGFQLLQQAIASTWARQSIRVPSLPP